MAKLRLFVILFFAVSFTGFVSKAQNITPSIGNSLLWKVSGNGLKSPSFLFGSYHLIGKDFIDTLPGISRSYNSTSAVVGELIIDNPMAMAQKMMPYMLLSGTTLDKLLTPAEYARTDSFFKAKSGMNLSMFNGMKPSAIQVTLMAELAEKTISDTNPGLDMYFQEQGKKDNKEVIGLETLEIQAKMLFDTPLERQKKQLLDLVKDFQKNLTESKEAFSYYKAQNLEGIGKLLLKTDGYTEEEMNALVSDRNKEWIRKLPTIMAKKPAFIIVGAAHLVGPLGLISLLRKEGYVVEPVNTRQ